MPRVSHYNPIWEQEHNWIAKCPKDATKALCKACGSEFSIKNISVADIRKHVGRDKHEKAYNIWKRQRTLIPVQQPRPKSNPAAAGHNNNNNSPASSSSSSKVIVTRKPSIITLNHTETVTKSEIIRALDIISNNSSLNCVNNDNAKYSAMFPDSQIAKNFRMKRSKLTYVIQHGLAPYFIEKQKLEMKDKLFCYHFDETTTAQKKSSMMDTSPSEIKWER